MDITLAARTNRIKPSPTIAVSNKAAELKAAGQDVIGLGAGEPDFDTPPAIKEAAKAAIDQGLTKYTQVDGTPGLKQAIIDKFARENNLDYRPEQILVSSGAKQSLFNLMQALLNEGDEVIIPAPYWVSYPDMVRITGAEPVIIKADQQQNFKISAQQLASAVTPKTRLFIINSPSNPSGMAYSEQELKALAEVLLQHPQLLIATDDIYEHILWNGHFVSLLNVCPALYERTIVVNGVSKAYAMTGWRIGYAAGPGKLIGAMKKVQSQSTSNPCSISQAAAQQALSGPQDCIKEMLTAFKQRHDFVVQALNQLPGVDCSPGDGTFYSFPNCQELISQLADVNNDVELAEYLLNKAGVALVPGSAFGLPGYLRLSYATGLDTLKQALARIKQAIQ